MPVPSEIEAMPRPVKIEFVPSQTIIEPLSSCSLAEAVQVWNEGFRGYFADMTLSLDGYLARMYEEGMSAENSLVAYYDGKLAGCLLNGIRANGTRKMAWNGGTGVIAEFRGRGVGKALVRAALNLYGERQVDVATLEALAQNEPAIKLYQSCGYEVVDRLILLQHDGKVQFPEPRHSYSIKTVTPYEVGQLEFYQNGAPWQSQWQGMMTNHGKAAVVYENDSPVGYVLYRKRFDDQGKPNGIRLHQCLAKPGHEYSEAIVLTALRYAYSPLDHDFHRGTHNLSQSNEIVCTILRDAGFTTFVEQVQMEKQVNNHVRQNHQSPV